MCCFFFFVSTTTNILAVVIRLAMNTQSTEIGVAHHSQTLLAVDVHTDEHGVIFIQLTIGRLRLLLFDFKLHRNREHRQRQE
jgi:hypothetical protein